MSRADLTFALAALVNAHGTTAVLESIRDACDAAADVSEAGRNEWSAASKSITAAAMLVVLAESRTGGPSLDMALTFLSDRSAP